MFWRVASGSVSSPVEALLEGEDFTLAQLLAEDKLVQEVNLPNRQLLDFLVKDSTLEELFHYIVDTPNASIAGEAKYKLPYAACEVLCCESDEILGAMASHPELFELLFTSSGVPHESDSVMATYFARVVAHILTQRGSELMDWLKDNRGALEGLTDRLETTGVAEALVRLVGADEATASVVPMQQLAWLPDTDVLPNLLVKLDSNEEFNVAENAAEVLAAIARARASPLTSALGAPGNLRRLVARAVDAPKSPALVQALNICIALVERRRLWEAAHDDGAAHLPNELDRVLELQAVEVLAPHASDLLYHLSDEQSEVVQETPYGLLQPPLGSARLTVIALLAVLLRTGIPAAEDAVIDAKLLPFCFSLFTSYPFNSILHHQVASILSSILESSSDALVRHVFEECNILSWLLEAPLEVDPIPCKEDSRSKHRTPLRAGYTGHLTQMGNKLVAVTETRPLVAGFLAEHERWQAFAAGRLAETNALEDTHAWDCGRPDLSRRLDSEGYDNLLTEADPLNGGYSSFGQGLRPFQSAFDDSDSDEGSPTRADQLFADMPDSDDADPFLADGLPGSPGSPGSLVGDMPPDAARAAKDPTKLFSQRSRMFEGEEEEDELANELSRDGFDVHPGSSPPPDMPREDMETIDLGPGWGSELNGLWRKAGGRSSLLAVPNSWEDLADDDTVERSSPPGNLSPRPASRRSPTRSPTERPPFAGALFGAQRTPAQASGSPPPLGESPLHGVLQASTLTEELRQRDARAGAAAEPEPHADEAVQRTATRQPSAGSNDGRHGASHGAMGSSFGIGRRLSNDRDAHPLSQRSGLDLEDLDAPSPSDKAVVAAETLSASTVGAADAGSGADREEQTLVGSFTKLDLSPQSPSHQESLQPDNPGEVQLAENSNMGESPALIPSLSGAPVPQRPTLTQPDSSAGPPDTEAPCTERQLADNQP